MLKLFKKIYNDEIIQVKGKACSIYRNNSISIFSLEDKVDVLFLFLSLSRNLEDLYQAGILNRKATLYHKMLNESEGKLDLKVVKELADTVNDRFRNNTELLEDNSLYSQELDFFLDIIKEMITLKDKMDNNSDEYKMITNNYTLKQVNSVIELNSTAIHLYESSSEFDHFNLFIQFISAEALVPFLNVLLNKELELRMQIESNINSTEVQITKNKNGMPAIILEHYNKEESFKFRSETIYNEGCYVKLHSLEYNGAILELVRDVDNTRIKVTPTFSYKPTSNFKDSFDIVSDYNTGDVYLEFNIKDSNYYILINNKALSDFEKSPFKCNLRDNEFIDIISKNKVVDAKESNTKYKNIEVLEKGSKFFYNILHSANLLRNPDYINSEVEKILFSINNNLVYPILTSKWIDVDITKDPNYKNKSKIKLNESFSWN